MANGLENRILRLEAERTSQSVTADELAKAREILAYDPETKEEAASVDLGWALVVCAKAAGGWPQFAQAALQAPLDQIRPARWLQNEMLSEVEAGRPDLARRVRDGAMLVEDANATMLGDERRRGWAAPPPPEPTPEPEWFRAATSVPGTAAPPPRGPSPYATPHTAHQPGAFDPRAERLAQWRADEEAAELERRRERTAREYRAGGREWFCSDE
jgi:hypothetical protein